MNERFYNAQSAGIRFNRRIYWPDIGGINRLNFNISSSYRISRSGNQLLNTCGRGSNSMCWNIDWCRLYKFINLFNAVQYTNQHATGLVLSQFGSQSYVYWINSDSKFSYTDMFFLRDLNVGLTISNIELYAGIGIQISSSAGSSSNILNVLPNNFNLIRLPSWQCIMLPPMCRVTIGIPLNSQHNNTNYSKAGTARSMGKRIYVRGLAMNAVDHPHGGNSGPSSSSVSPWGWTTK